MVHFYSVVGVWSLSILLLASLVCAVPVAETGDDDGSDEDGGDASADLAPPEVTPEMMAQAFTQLHECTGDRLDLSDLDGDWQLAYYKLPIEGLSAELKLSATDGDKLDGTVSISGPDNFHESRPISAIRPKADTPTLLVNPMALPDGTIVPIPILVLASKRNSFHATMYLASLDPQTIDWAIYQKVNGQALTESDVQRVEDVIKCLGIKALDEQQPLLFPAQGCKCD